MTEAMFYLEFSSISLACLNTNQGLAWLKPIRLYLKQIPI
jgi:hypothetical protein